MFGTTAMAAKLFARLRVKNPAELAQRAHQAFVRLPYESSQDRVVEELSRLMSGIKVSWAGMLHGGVTVTACCTAASR